MDYSDYLLYKALALCAIVVVVSFVYALITGQTLEEARSDKRQERTDQAER